MCRNLSIKTWPRCPYRLENRLGRHAELILANCAVDGCDTVLDPKLLCLRQHRLEVVASDMLLDGSLIFPSLGEVENGGVTDILRHKEEVVARTFTGVCRHALVYSLERLRVIRMNAIGGHNQCRLRLCLFLHDQSSFFAWIRVVKTGEAGCRFSSDCMRTDGARIRRGLCRADLPRRRLPTLPPVSSANREAVSPSSYQQSTLGRDRARVRRDPC